jgi:hypothetical protein
MWMIVTIINVKEYVIGGELQKAHFCSIDPNLLSGGREGSSFEETSHKWLQREEGG